MNIMLKSTADGLQFRIILLRLSVLHITNEVVCCIPCCIHVYHVSLVRSLFRCDLQCSTFYNSSTLQQFQIIHTFNNPSLIQSLSQRFLSRFTYYCSKGPSIHQSLTALFTSLQIPSITKSTFCNISQIQSGGMY